MNEKPDKDRPDQDSAYELWREMAEQEAFELLFGIDQNAESD